MKFVAISAPLSAMVSRSFLNPMLVTPAGLLCLPRLIGTGESKEASLIREISAHLAPPGMSGALILTRFDQKERLGVNRRGFFPVLRPLLDDAFDRGRRGDDRLVHINIGKSGSHCAFAPCN
jgi:hypothetical protein